MQTLEQNTGVATLATETNVNINPSPVATETVTTVKAKGTVGRPTKLPKVFVANEDGSIKMVDGQPVKLGRGKPAKNTLLVWAIPSKVNSAEMTYTIVPRPAKKVKAAVPVEPAQLAAA
jgi:hypothetical protein